MKETISRFIRHAGPIRNILYVLALITIIFKPNNSTELTLEGIQIVTTLILPVIAPLLVTGFFLDTLMSRIYSSEQTDDIKKKFRAIIIVDLVLAITLLVSWVPYMLAMN